MVKSWEKYCLADIGTFKKGSGISREESNSGTIPAVRYGEIYTTHNDCVRNYTSHISREVAQKALRVNYGDLLFACSGETKEEIAKCASIIDDKEVYAGGDIIVLSPTVKADPVFWGYILNTANVVKQRAQKAQGDAIVHISTNSLKQIEVTVPDYDEQQKIAKALSDMDELIASLENLIAKKRAIKRGTMQELLTGKKRLPGFRTEWEEIKIGNHGELTKTSINPQDYPNEIFMEYSMPAFDDGCAPVVTKGNTMHSNRTLIEGEVLLFNKLNVRQRRIWYISDCEPNAVCSSEFLAYQSTDLDLRLLSQILNTDKVTDDFINMSTGTSNSQRRITPANFMDYVVKLPIDIVEQTAIASILFDMDAEIKALEKKLAKCRHTKQGMMQQLLTGKIRLV